MGLAARLWKATKINYALSTGFYYQKPDILGKSRRPTPIGAGMKRAAARLAAHRKAQAERLAQPQTNQTTHPKG